MSLIAVVASPERAVLLSDGQVTGPDGEVRQTDFSKIFLLPGGQIFAAIGAAGMIRLARELEQRPMTFNTLRFHLCQFCLENPELNAAFFVAAPDGSRIHYLVACAGPEGWLLEEPDFKAGDYVYLDGFIEDQKAVDEKLARIEGLPFEQKIGAIEQVFHDLAECSPRIGGLTFRAQITPRGTQFSTQHTAVAQDSFFARTLGARLNSGRPWIDFSEGIHSGKHLDNIADGATYGRVANTALTSGLVDLSKSGVLPKGAIPPVLYSAFSYTSTTTSITWSWSSFILYRCDGTQLSVGSGSVTVTGLTSATTYYFYPYWDEGASQVAWLGSGHGSPAYAYLAAQRSNALAQSQNGQVYVALSNGPISAATTSSGGGSGSGGGTGTCLRSDMLVQTQERGNVRACDVQLGEHLSCPAGWTQVTHKQVRPQSVWIQIETSQSGTLVVTPTHELTLHDGSEKAAQSLTLSDLLTTRLGCDPIKTLSVLREEGEKVLLSCSPTHTFFAGKDAASILAHNLIFTC